MIQAADLPVCGSASGSQMALGLCAGGSVAKAIDRIWIVMRTTTLGVVVIWGGPDNGSEYPAVTSLWIARDRRATGRLPDFMGGGK